ncbi:MAG: hypothetical protein A3G08_04215 [Candidatus Magasanikbacteria bacterium RIFCSPLOWO2_12_FULL_47_9b]|nr:MAG: hypothetical protein A3I74_02845 [Candidatus Magasanikbacteria bacterium RIFCSPLOWO2_02_FULL_47_16]OGH83297.1 MAG: hypothetical protein A3G08_04215 [Candidatus Magasanikbacteria bacterium RIFCSPLOWO2_12_FULL_47_9b]
MIKALVSDFSRVLLSPKDNNYTGGLNALHKELSASGDYDFWAYFQLNQELLAFYKTISEDTGTYLFTTEYIQEHPALQPHLTGVFKQTFSGGRLGLKKTDAQSFRFIAAEIGFTPQEILYIDDKQENLDAAEEAGIVTILYQNNTQVIKDITDTVKSFRPDI